MASAGRLARSRLTMTCRRAPHDVGRAQRTTPPAYRARQSTAITERSALLCCHRRDGETDEATYARYVLYVLYSSYPYSLVL